jgi:hypothetical protein
MLYRPFLHYISPRLTAGKKIEDRYYNCAAAGITVSRNIIHIALEIQKQAVLIGPYWFILYTVFFAILSLLFFVLENPDKPGSAEILADAKAGRDVIASLAQRSLAADRITTALNVRLRIHSWPNHSLMLTAFSLSSNSCPSGWRKLRPGQHRRRSARLRSRPQLRRKDLGRAARRCRVVRTYKTESRSAGRRRWSVPSACFGAKRGRPLREPRRLTRLGFSTAAWQDKASPTSTTSYP